MKILVDIVAIEQNGAVDDEEEGKEAVDECNDRLLVLGQISLIADKKHGGEQRNHHHSQHGKDGQHHDIDDRNHHKNEDDGQYNTEHEDVIDDDDHRHDFDHILE